jgi:hypothetical protein
MANVTLGKKIGYQSAVGVEPITVLNGTDVVVLKFADDYSSIVLSATNAAGAETLYESQLIESGTVKQFIGGAVSAAAVYAEILATGATGSTYQSTAGGFYFQVANAGAASDWETVTTS